MGQVKVSPDRAADPKQLPWLLHPAVHDHLVNEHTDQTNLLQEQLPQFFPALERTL